MFTEYIIVSGAIQSHLQHDWHEGKDGKDDGWQGEQNEKHAVLVSTRKLQQHEFTRVYDWNIQTGLNKLASVVKSVSA